MGYSTRAVYVCEGVALEHVPMTLMQRYRFRVRALHAIGVKTGSAK